MTATYKPLGAILSIPDAIKADSFHAPAQTLTRGDPDAALSASKHRLSGELFVNGQDHFYLETHVSWAVPEPDGSVQVYASTQHPSETQEVVAQVLGVAAQRAASARPMA